MISYKSINRQEVSNSGAKTSTTNLIDSYYQEEKDDYYTKEKQPSEWYGNLSQDLGLLGKNVAKEDFSHLLNGEYKGNTLRDSSYKKKDTNDRLAIDLTFNAPKSVSIMALVAGDTRLIQAHNEAVKESLDLIETFAQGRKKVGGKSTIENTNKIAAAMFRHDTNRNNDPHLHTHSVVLNITKRSDGEYRALHNDKLVRAIPVASQNYQNILAKKCRELGYDIRINENGLFDLAHISREQLMQFSSRGKEVEENLAKMGLTRQTATKEQRQKANLLTRQKKQKTDKKEIQSHWAKIAQNLGLDKVLNTNIIQQKEVNHERNRGGNTERSHSNQNNIASPSTIGGQTNAETDGLHGVSSSNVAGDGERREMLLQDNSQLELHEQRTYSNKGLRWYSNDISRLRELKDDLIDKFGKKTKESTQKLENVATMEEVKTLNSAIKYQNLQTQTDNEHETFKDMITYEPPNSEITQEWQDFAKSLNMTFEKGTTKDENDYFSADKLVHHVVQHLLDKKVEITKDEIIKQMLVKGFGVVDYKQSEQLLNDYVKQGNLVQTHRLYKPADERDDSKARTANEWIEFLSKDKQIDKQTAINFVQKGINENRLVEVKERYTTQENIDREMRILRFMKKGQGVLQPFYTEKESEQVLQDTTLNDGQKSAAKLIMTTKDRVVGIQGFAGVGKSYTLSETIKHINNAGGQAHLFAPYSSQVKSLQADGHEANTLAKLLHSPKMQKELDKDSVIIVDEAGVVNNKQMEQLLKLAREKQCRVVLLGDTQQTKAIEAGKPFDLLQTQGMNFAVIDEIQRQKNETLKKAVIEAATNQSRQSVQTLGKSILQIQDRDERLNSLVSKYVQMLPDERDKTLIVTGTNEDKDYINGKIRDDLKLSGTGVKVKILKSVDMSKEEMSHARYYKDGYIIQTNTKPHNTDLKKDCLYEVIGKERQLLIVKDEQGRVVKFSPNNEKLSVFTSKDAEFSAGDKVKITKSNAQLGVATGDSLTVIKTSASTIVAQDNKTGSIHKFNVKDRLNLDHNYCSTVHSSQGLTVDNVLININTYSKTTSKEVYYVAVSRAKHQAYIVTDDIQKLPDVITKGADKHSAFELTGGYQKIELAQPKQKEKQKIKQSEFEM